MKYSKELHDDLRTQPYASWDQEFNQEMFTALLDEIDRLNASRRWIPVSERLPEMWTTILIRCSDNYMTTSQLMSDPKNGNIIFSLKDVTHWMPLPPAPESEGE